MVVHSASAESSAHRKGQKTSADHVCQAEAQQLSRAFGRVLVLGRVQSNMARARFDESHRAEEKRFAAPGKTPCIPNQKECGHGRPVRITLVTCSMRMRIARKNASTIIA